MAYRNINRSGITSSTTYDPRRYGEDISESVYELDAYRTPFLSFLNQFARAGSPPKAPKIWTKMYHNFDHLDYASACIKGSSIDATYSKFGRITLDQPSRPDTASDMYYHSQDTFHIQATGQEVIVVMTENDSMRIKEGTTSDCFFTFPDNTFTGSTTTRSASGTVIVKTVNGEDFIGFTTSDVFYTARTLFESQDIEGTGHSTDYIWTCNFVEHIEDTFQMTEDLYKWIKMKDGKAPWDFETRQTMNKLKISTEYKALFGQKGVDMTVKSKPRYHMGGLLHELQTNVMVYSPNLVTDYEELLMTMVDRAYQYNPTKNRDKLAICGRNFARKVNKAFRDDRQIQSSGAVTQTLGWNVKTYEFMDGKLSFMVSDALRGAYEDWCFIIDPKLVKLRVVPGMDFTARPYSLATQRDKKWMVEWQGTIEWEYEQAHALLRTA